MSRPRIATLIAASTVAVALLAAVLLPDALESRVTHHGTLLPAGALGADFTLRSADGPVSLADFRGQAVLLFFGYTTCPDACPLTMVRLKRAMDLLGDAADDVQVLLVSVDPAVDTPERLHGFVTGFDQDFLGLTGDRASLTAITRAYGVHAGQPGEGPMALGGGDTVGADNGAATVDRAGAGEEPHHHDPTTSRVIPHTTHVFGIDRDGEVRLLWDARTTAEEIAADVRSLLRL